MAGGATAAANRRNAEYAEYGTGIAIALSALTNEARELAFSKQGRAEVKRSWGSQSPDVMRIDLDGDKKPDTVLKYGYTWYGAVDKIDIDGTCISRPRNSDIGRLQSVTVDSNKTLPAVTITVDRDVFGVDKIRIDTNRDGKPDMIFKPDTDWLGGANGMHVDLNSDGKNDRYIKFKRNWCGNIDAVELRLSK